MAKENPTRGYQRIHGELLKLDFGKAGNPDIMLGVDPDLVVGASTDVRSAEGMIATAGAIDVHVHFDSAGLCEEAIASGVTTLLGGGLGPETVGICSSGPVGLTRMLQTAEGFPLNFGFLGNGSANRVEPLLEQESTRRPTASTSMVNHAHAPR